MLDLDLPKRQPQMAGQHFVVRLTAQDGYTASRSYSVASSPMDPLVELCVERLDDGEVSAYLYDVVEPGDKIEVRGPIGGWFVWDGATSALAIGGGTGVVPLVAMLRQARKMGRPELLKLAASGRHAADLPYLPELRAHGSTISITGDPASGFLPHRLGAADLKPLIADVDTVFVCGSSGFAEAISTVIVGLGVPAGHVRVERFGPTG